MKRGSGACRSRSTALALPANAGEFERHALLACFEIKAHTGTRHAYWRDYCVWHSFYDERAFNPADPPRGAVPAFNEYLKALSEAPKTRARRISALSSIYRRLCRPGDKDEPPIAARNPFSPDAVDREMALPLEPTPLAEPELVGRVLATCDESELGRRDEAILRILWGTGMRRVSLLSMRPAQIRRERDGFVASVIGKRGKRLRVLIKGRAVIALEKWLAILKAAKISRGPIWLTPRGRPMTARDVSRMIDLRLEQIGEEAGALTPHMFRVSFLTLNPAGLEAKSDAAGHSDPKTTRIYDRSSWRGLEAFKAMPEVEDVVTEGVS